MAGGLGQLGYIGFAPESSGGTAVSAEHFVQALSEALRPEYDRYDRFNIINRLSEPDDKSGVLRLTGPIEAPFDPVVMGHWLKAAIGDSDSVTSLGGGLWTHVWQEASQSQWDDRFALAPYTLEIFRDVGSAQQYAGCNLGRLDLMIEPNADLRMNTEWVGVNFTNIAAGTASYSGVAPFDWSTTSLSIDGVANANFEAFTFQLDNKLEGIPTLSNKRTVHKIRRQEYASTRIQGTIGFENITDLTRFINETEMGFVLNWTQGSYQVSLDLPRVLYTSFPVGMGGRDRQIVEFDGTCRHHQGSGTAYEIRLTTTVGSY